MPRIVHASIKHAPGDTRIFLRECRTLAAAGYEVHWLAPAAVKGTTEGVRTGPIAPWVELRENPVRTAANLIAARRTIGDLAPRLVHIHDPEMIPIGLALRREGVRVVYDVHEDSPAEALEVHRDRPWFGRAKWLALKGLEARAFARFDWFIAATDAIARRLPRDRTTVVTNYPMRAEFEAVLSHPFAERKPQVVFVGTISSTRAARELVQAMSLLPDDLPAELVFAGKFVEPGLEDHLRAMAGWRRCRFEGWLDRNGVRRLLAESLGGIVLFHPYGNNIEAMPNKLFEYMAAGVPIIASDFPLWRSIVGRADAGLLVNPADPQAIAQAIATIVSDRTRAAVMGAHGRRVVETACNWESESVKLLEVYRRLVGPPAPLPAD